MKIGRLVIFGLNLTTAEKTKKQLVTLNLTIKR